MLKASAQERDRALFATAGAFTAVALATYPIGGLALLMPAVLLVFFGTVHRRPRWARTAARGVIVVATLIWPITWIGLGLLATPMIVPMFIWAVYPHGSGGP